MQKSENILNKYQIHSKTFEIISEYYSRTTLLGHGYKKYSADNVFLMFQFFRQYYMK